MDAAATFASLAFAALLSYFLTASLSGSAMLEWGWRVVSVVAVPLGLIGVYIRVRLEESPLFQQILNGPPTVHTPLSQTLKEEWRPMLRVGAYISLTALSFYIFSTYMTTFLRVFIQPSDQVLLSNVIPLTFAALIAPSSGASATELDDVRR